MAQYRGISKGVIWFFEKKIPKHAPKFKKMPSNQNTPLKQFLATTLAQYHRFYSDLFFGSVGYFSSRSWISKVTISKIF